MMFCLQPHHIGKLPALQELWLDHNQLQHLPSVSDFLTVMFIIIIIVIELFNYLKKDFTIIKMSKKCRRKLYASWLRIELEKGKQ